MNKQSESNIIKDSFRINIRLLKLVGLYYSYKHPSLSLVLGLLFYVMLTILIPVLGLIKCVSGTTSNALVTEFTPGYVVSTLFFTIKLLPFLAITKRVRECINCFGDPYYIPDGKEQKIILDECVKICQRNSFFYFIAVIVCISFINIPPLFLTTYKLPLNVWLPYDHSTNLLTYYSTYLLIAMSVSYNAIIGSTVDPLVGGLAYHATSQLKVLNYNLQHLNNWKSKVSSLKFYSIIKDCIHHHEAIISFINEYEVCFSWVAFSQFASTTGTVGFFFADMNKIMATSAKSTSTPVLISCAFASVFQSLFYCYYGQLLFEEHDDISKAIYLSEWYDYDIPSQRALAVVMERAKVPMIIRAGKIINLTLDTFARIVKTIYSLATVLQNVE